MTVIDLFAGGGGASLGLRRAGFHHLALVEKDRSAASTLEAADFKPVLQQDIRTVDWRAYGDSPDLVWTSPPCQAWSVAGRRLGAKDSERNGWPWIWTAIDQLKPRWMVAENVVGLLHHSSTACGDPVDCPGCYWNHEVLTAALQRFSWVGWWLLDAAAFGLPQHRRRIFLVAGPGTVPAPPPTHIHPDQIKQQVLFTGSTLMPFRTMREALGLSEPSPLLDQPAPTVTASEGKGHTNPHRALERGRSGAVCRASDLLYLATGRKKLEPCECAILQGFPEGWPFQGSKQDRYRQIGNAVPPVLAERIGRQILIADASF